MQQPELGRAARKVRQAAGLTLQAVAVEAGMSMNVICDMEAGRRPANGRALAALERLTSRAVGELSRYAVGDDVVAWLRSHPDEMLAIRRLMAEEGA